MRARVGDRLIVEGDHTRTGLVIGVKNEDGSPPYAIRWLANGHVALVFPNEYSRIVPAEDTAASARWQTTAQLRHRVPRSREHGDDLSEVRDWAWGQQAPAGP